MNNHNYNYYCEKCDKWLNSPNDYEKFMTGINIVNVKCKTCDSVYHEWELEAGGSRCKYCNKNVADEETFKKNQNKLGWLKGVLVEHNFNANEGIVINHDCFIKCENNSGGKSCGKQWKLTKENFPIMFANEFAFFSNNSCVDCRLEEMEKQIEEWKKEGKVPNKETKEYYEELKKMAGKNNDKLQEREREREREHFGLF